MHTPWPGRPSRRVRTLQGAGRHPGLRVSPFSSSSSSSSSSGGAEISGKRSERHAEGARPPRRQNHISAMF